MADGDKVTVYRDSSGEWRWSKRARNGNVIADGSEGYNSKRNAKKAAKRANPDTPVVVK